MPALQTRHVTDWKPGLGAWFENRSAHFRLWAPEARSIDLVLEPKKLSTLPLPLKPSGDGYFTGVFPDIEAGTRYRFCIDGDRSLPDPASRFQPEGVHGPSQVVDPSQFAWTDANWTGLEMEDLILYELHVGTFSAEGTFNGVRKKLHYLRDLGITAIELMPVADFPGNRGWGYDGVDLFAPTRCYGTPDELRQLVNDAHAMNIGVFLDVVYNHLGPEGAYLGAFSPYYFSPKHKSPWGDAVNLDDKHCQPVRDFFIENALHWIHEYHIDGLRLDATHALVDDNSTHFLQELAERVHASLPKERKVLLIAEDDRNQARLIQSACQGGYGLDAVWADDFHHQVRRMLAGDDDGYFQDFTGNAKDLAKTIRQGWFYTGQKSAFRKGPRGTPTEGIPPQQFVHCVQNHDQVGNRALGDRLNSTIDPASFRAVSALLLLSPATPLIFMGQEWAASTPFCYFTDHPEALGKAVTEGRRNEFRHFKAFSDPESRKIIPDPQALSTFQNCKLNWAEHNREPHAGTLRLYRELLNLRKAEPARQRKAKSFFEVEALDKNILALKRETSNHSSLLAISCLQGSGRINLDTLPVTRPPDGSQWRLLLTTEDDAFTGASSPPHTTAQNGRIILDFQGPCTAVFRAIKPD
jgi:maltooligosyltrehalose trehalohydrolase